MVVFYNFFFFGIVFMDYNPKPNLVVESIIKNPLSKLLFIIRFYSLRTFDNFLM